VQTIPVDINLGTEFLLGMNFRRRPPAVSVDQQVVAEGNKEHE
jgi:hypothetical protein